MILLEQGKTPQQIKSEIDALNKELPWYLMVNVSSKQHHGKKRKHSKRPKSLKKWQKSEGLKVSKKEIDECQKSQKNKKSK